MHLNPKCQTDTALGCQVILVGCMEICDWNKEKNKLMDSGSLVHHGGIDGST